MKTIKKQFKSIVLILSMLILLQGCTVYKSASVSLDQASKSEIKVKVETTNGEKLKFKRIGVENGNYYGVKKSNGVIVKTPLDPKIINTIKEKDKTLSTIITVGVSAITFLGITIGVWVLAGSPI